VCRAARKVHDQVAASPQPNLPIIWSEYNASYKNEPDVTDSPYMGPWLADTIRQCDGLSTMMSYWTFSDVFEEQGVVKEPFYGGFGLIGERGLPKPAYNAFKLLHYLGSERIPVDSDSGIVTRRIDGSLAIAVWNIFPPEERGRTKQVSISIKGLTGSHHAVISRVDQTHGSLLNAYEAMGRPKSPTLAEIERLREAAQLGSPETEEIEGGQLMISLPPQALALIEIQ